MNDSLANEASQAISTLDEYQTIALKTDQNEQEGLDGLAFCLIGLFGETGKLLNTLKKKQRDKDSFVSYSEALIDDFGDVLWYLSNIASRASLSLSMLAKVMHTGLEGSNDQPMVYFGSIQSEMPSGNSLNTVEFEAALITLSSKVGLLLNEFNENRIPNSIDVLSAHLITVFDWFIKAADLMNVDLIYAANQNIRKIHSRWPEKQTCNALFDEDYDSLEQLPRVINMHILETSSSDKTYVIQQCNGITIGSTLTDNRVESDDYRFHDVFHLAYAAVLGWSPVLRALLKVKRKSNPIVDEAEDGNRAILIEEGISTLVFQRALRYNFFDSVDTLDFELLNVISDFVRGYEVESCSLWQWEKAILDGYAVFRQLRKHRQGIVIADLDQRSISFQELIP